MKTRTDAHDDVALRDQETITWWAMMHNMDDDRVPCSGPGCTLEARWRHACPGCGVLRTRCTPTSHMSKPNASFTRCTPERGGCDGVFATAEWMSRYLPM